MRFWKPYSPWLHWAAWHKWDHFCFWSLAKMSKAGKNQSDVAKNFANNFHQSKFGFKDHINCWKCPQLLAKGLCTSSAGRFWLLWIYANVGFYENNKHWGNIANIGMQFWNTIHLGFIRQHDTNKIISDSGVWPRWARQAKPLAILLKILLTTFTNLKSALRII